MRPNSRLNLFINDEFVFSHKLSILACNNIIIYISNKTSNNVLNGYNIDIACTSMHKKILLIYTIIFLCFLLIQKFNVLTFTGFGF